MPAPSPGPDLWEVVAPACAAASVGTMAAVLGSLRQLNPELRLEFDLITVLCGLAGAGAGWGLGRGLWKLARTPRGEDPSPRVRRRVILGFVALGGLTLLAFAVATLGLPDTRRGDMVSGAIMALVVLGLVGGVLYLLIRLLGSPDDPGSDPE